MDIIKNNIFNIKQLSYNDFYINIINNEYTILLFDSLVKTNLLFPGTNNNNNLFFKAISVEILNKNHLKTESDYVNLLETISIQLFYLEKLGYTFYGFDLNDILVIDKCIYCILNPIYIKEIVNKSIIFDSPFKKPFFSSPEINLIKNIPQKISYKSVYYSIGALIIYFKYNTYMLKITDQEDIENIISNIKYTSMYWFLKRCFEENIEDRCLVYL